RYSESSKSRTRVERHTYWRCISGKRSSPRSIMETSSSTLASALAMLFPRSGCEQEALAVPLQIMQVLAGQPAQPHARLNAKPLQIACGQAGAGQQMPGIVEADQKAIKQCIQIGNQQKAIEGIQPLGITGALGPGFGMAGTQHLGHIDAGYRTGATPIGE